MIIQNYFFWGDGAKSVQSKDKWRRDKMKKLEELFNEPHLKEQNFNETRWLSLVSPINNILRTLSSRI